jgi:prepilin-type processing-associated H-X9-DG protein
MECNIGRASFVIGLLPYLESSPRYNDIMQPMDHNGQAFPAGGPAPWIAEYPPWQEKIPFFVCPSSSNVADEMQATLGRTNYGAVVGDIAKGLHTHPGVRGFFNPGTYLKRGQISDGAGATIAIAEFASPSGRMLLGQYAVDQPTGQLVKPSACLKLGETGHYAAATKLSSLGRGSSWADGGAGPGMVNTILPPNSASCAVGGNIAVDGFYSASSLHTGGVNVAMADGSVQFISQNIDCNSLDARPLQSETWSREEQRRSPFGIWGALGTVGGDDQGQEGGNNRDPQP